jgi:hypothetical protein
MSKFDAGVAGGEPPVHLAFVGVGGAGPGGEFGVEKGKVGDAPAEALLGQDPDFSADAGMMLCFGGVVTRDCPCCQGKW